MGGNSARNGMSEELGPSDATLLWSGGPGSRIASQPIISNGRVIVVRERKSAAMDPTDSPIIALNLNTGRELWRSQVPFNPGEWSTWLAGASMGKVFAVRSGNGASVRARVYAYRETDGSRIWVSEEDTDAGPLDGAVFAPSGDPIIGGYSRVIRYNASNGRTVWSVRRTATNSVACGAAVFGNGVFITEAASRGTVIRKLNIATGAVMYSSPIMTGQTVQNAPMVGPDGTVYLARSQGRAQSDKLYSFADTGSALSLRWAVPIGHSGPGSFALGPEYSVYALATDGSLARFDTRTGVIRSRTQPLARVPGEYMQPRLLTDATGRVYMSTGGFERGRLMAFEPNLSPLWEDDVPYINAGGPALGRDGVLVVAGIGSDIRAYGVPGFACPADVDDGSGTGTRDRGVTVDDVIYYMSAYEQGALDADLDDGNGGGLQDGGVTVEDLLFFLLHYEMGC